MSKADLTTLARTRHSEPRSAGHVRQADQSSGIIGIAGLGHMAVKFAAAYGCDVTAFTSSESKFDEA